MAKSKMNAAVCYRGSLTTELAPSPASQRRIPRHLLFGRSSSSLRTTSSSIAPLPVSLLSRDEPLAGVPTEALQWRLLLGRPATAKEEDDNIREGLRLHHREGGQPHYGNDPLAPPPPLAMIQFRNPAVPSGSSSSYAVGVAASRLVSPSSSVLLLNPPSGGATKPFSVASSRTPSHSYLVEPQPPQHPYEVLTDSDAPVHTRQQQQHRAHITNTMESRQPYNPPIAEGRGKPLTFFDKLELHFVVDTEERPTTVHHDDRVHPPPHLPNNNNQGEDEEEEGDGALDEEVVAHRATVPKETQTTVRAHRRARPEHKGKVKESLQPPSPSSRPIKQQQHHRVVPPIAKLPMTPSKRCTSTSGLPATPACAGHSKRPARETQPPPPPPPAYLGRDRSSRGAAAPSASSLRGRSAGVSPILGRILSLPPAHLLRSTSAPRAARPSSSSLPLDAPDVRPPFNPYVGLRGVPIQPLLHAPPTTMMTATTPRWVTAGGAGPTTGPPLTPSMSTPPKRAASPRNDPPRREHHHDPSSSSPLRSSPSLPQHREATAGLQRGGEGRQSGSPKKRVRRPPAHRAEPESYGEEEDSDDTHSVLRGWDPSDVPPHLKKVTSSDSKGTQTPPRQQQPHQHHPHHRADSSMKPRSPSPLSSTSARVVLRREAALMDCGVQTDAEQDDKANVALPIPQPVQLAAPRSTFSAHSRSSDDELPRLRPESSTSPRNEQQPSAPPASVEAQQTVPGRHPTTHSLPTTKQDDESGDTDEDDDSGDANQQLTESHPRREEEEREEGGARVAHETTQDLTEENESNDVDDDDGASESDSQQFDQDAVIQALCLDAMEREMVQSLALRYWRQWLASLLVQPKQDAQQQQQQTPQRSGRSNSPTKHQILQHSADEEEEGEEKGDGDHSDEYEEERQGEEEQEEAEEPHLQRDTTSLENAVYYSLDESGVQQTDSHSLASNVNSEEDSGSDEQQPDEEEGRGSSAEMDQTYREPSIQHSTAMSAPSSSSSSTSSRSMSSSPPSSPEEEHLVAPVTKYKTEEPDQDEKREVRGGGGPHLREGGLVNDESPPEDVLNISDISAASPLTPPPPASPSSPRPGSATPRQNNDDDHNNSSKTNVQNAPVFVWSEPNEPFNAAADSQPLNPKQDEKDAVEEDQSRSTSTSSSSSSTSRTQSTSSSMPPVDLHPLHPEEATTTVYDNDDPTNSTANVEKDEEGNELVEDGGSGADAAPNTRSASAPLMDRIKSWIPGKLFARRLPPSPSAPAETSMTTPSFPPPPFAIVSTEAEAERKESETTTPLESPRVALDEVHNVPDGQEEHYVSSPPPAPGQSDEEQHTVEEEEEDEERFLTPHSARSSSTSSSSSSSDDHNTTNTEQQNEIEEEVEEEEEEWEEVEETDHDEDEEAKEEEHEAIQQQLETPIPPSVSQDNRLRSPQPSPVSLSSSSSATPERASARDEPLPGDVHSSASSSKSSPSSQSSSSESTPSDSKPPPLPPASSPPPSSSSSSSPSSGSASSPRRGRQNPLAGLLADGAPPNSPPPSMLLRRDISSAALGMSTMTIGSTTQRSPVSGTEDNDGEGGASSPLPSSDEVRRLVDELHDTEQDREHPQVELTRIRVFHSTL